MIEINTPLTKEKVSQLRVGDRVLISGTIYTARDAAHKRLINMIKNEEELPFDPKDQVIFYVGPSPTKEGNIIGSAGPTTSYRMDSYVEDLLKLGLTGMIGKGKRSDEVVGLIEEYNAVYFAATGGAGALISKAIKSSKEIAFVDLGTECIRELKVEKLPVVVVNDTKGNDLYNQVREG